MSSEAEDPDFLREILEFYRSHKRVLDRGLSIRLGEMAVRGFCSDVHGVPSYYNFCKLALVFANVLGTRMPDHIHARIALGPSNEGCREYILYAMSLKPNLLGFNLNRNGFRGRSLGFDGHVLRMMRK
jgi:hypothetical protein